MSPRYRHDGGDRGGLAALAVLDGQVQAVQQRRVARHPLVTGRNRQHGVARARINERVGGLPGVAPPSATSLRVFGEPSIGSRYPLLYLFAESKARDDDGLA